MPVLPPGLRAGCGLPLRLGRHLDAAGHGCLGRLSVRPCGACRGTCPGLGWGCFPLHQPDCGSGGAGAPGGGRGYVPLLCRGFVPAFYPELRFRFGSPPGVGLLCGRRQHPRPAALGREGVGYKGPGALPRHQLADHHLHLYLPGPAFLHRGGPLQPGYHRSFAGKPKRPVEGPGAGHRNQGVRPRQLPAHPRQVFHLSRGLGVCKRPGRKFHRPLCFVSKKRSGCTAPFLYVHNQLPKNGNLLTPPYKGERKIAAALFPRVSSALPAPKPCIRGPAG